METLKPQAEYFRDYGTHRFVTMGKQVVAAVSSNNWEQAFIEVADAADDTDIVITPEVITYPHHQAEIAANREVIESRIEDTRLASLGRRALILLGSPTFGDNGQVYNSLVAIQDGRLRPELHTNKSFLSGYERSVGVITPDYAPKPLIAGHITPIICSELAGIALQAPNISPRRVAAMDPATTTVLVSSCWAVPGMLANSEFYREHPDIDHYFGRQIGYAAGLALERNPNLQEFIMVDRNVAESRVNGPFNVQLRRPGVILD